MATAVTVAQTTYVSSDLRNIFIFFQKLLTIICTYTILIERAKKAYFSTDGTEQVMKAVILLHF